MHDILQAITDRRRADIAALGCTLGATVPEQRTRSAPVPFIAQKGVVLEIKRASPSKGDIAPHLDAAQTARQYAAAGAAAISVLTEHHWFKGSLDDLQAAARAADEYARQNGTPRVAILRKDFLLTPDEIDVAYRAGADAVLLIARILSADALTAMAQACARRGMTAFIEVRHADDLQKLAAAAQKVPPAHIVCGVNARDLQDFSIDLLTPARMLSHIKAILGSDARCIFESGIRTPQAARFAGSLGFTGMLLGEAAARNPADARALVTAFVDAPPTQNAAQWQEFAEKPREKPFVKICGLTNLPDARKAAALGADFLGFIFWAASPRRADEATVRHISSEIRAGARQSGTPAPKLVGVIVDADSDDGKTVRRLVREGVLDFIQLHGCADAFFATPDTDLAHYAVVNVSDETDLAHIDALRLRGEPRILIDAKAGLLPGGTGKRIADALVEKVARKTRLWLAGGITPENVRSVCDTFRPELIDVASGTESAPGKKDAAKLEKLFAELKKIIGFRQKKT